jgi:hypothetical protein
MMLRGVLDRSLDNFWCLRGFAPMGVLYDISEPDPSFQRDLIKLHEKEMLSFLRDAEYLFFPEVVLCATLCNEGETSESVERLFQTLQTHSQLPKLDFGEFTLLYGVHKVLSKGDRRVLSVLRRARLQTRKTFTHKFSRIDGNHRLSATPKDPKFSSLNTPFCLLLFRNKQETAKFSRALFHNINYKSVALTMEENLKLILDDPNLFTDAKLKENESFGWPYYHARKLYTALDFEVFGNLRPFIEKEPRTFLVEQFTFLTEQDVLGDNENAIQRFKAALVKVNGLFEIHPALKDSRNRGLLAALVYYELKKGVPVSSFLRWVLNNHLHQIEESGSEDLIAIFDKVLTSRKRTVFVSMPFGKPKADDHYAIIQRVCKEVSETYNLKPALRVERVDWFHDGTSYEINDKIIAMMSDCGLLIGNLTHCNPNVYHEIGFIMGKAKAEGKDVANMLLFLDESVPDDKDKFVGFNLRGVKQLRFSRPELDFAPALRENLERFFKLKP